MRVYVGLASTVHDPAIAFVDEDGEVLFAEAVERPMQYKRAWHQLPDDALTIEKLLDRYVPLGAEVVTAQSWRSRRLTGPLFRAGYAALESRLDPRLRPTILGQMNSFAGAGLELAHRLARRPGRPSPIATRHYDHHLSHAAMACFSSGLPDATCAIVDANGERTSESFFSYRGGRIEPLGRARRGGFRKNGSLGAFYAGLCEACGFDPVRGEEWKVMGLAPYGRLDDALLREMRSWLRVEGLALRGDSFAMLEALRRLRRPWRDPLEAADLAFTGQRFFAERMAELLTNLHRRAPSPRLVLGGGCALNSAFNGELLARTPFEQLFVPCAPADDGNAIGAAWLARREDHPRSAPPVARLTPYLGSRLSPEGLGRVLAHSPLAPSPLGPGVTAMQRAAELLADSKIVAVARGRAEHGPRALGHRSILADPRDPSVKDRLNRDVKRREPFRPFAPSVLHERGDAWFEGYAESPHMERALAFRDEVRGRVPGVVHVDGTGRVQSVSREGDRGFYDLLVRFEARTGVPLVLNTSLNVMGKPIAHSVEDVLAIFYSTGVDALVLDDLIFEKPPRAQEPREA